MGEVDRERGGRREISLSLFYMRYFLYQLIGIGLVGVFVLFALNALLVSDMIYPADYAQGEANAAYSDILKADKVSEDMIPKMCSYVVFNGDGEVITGDIEKKGVKRAWAAVQGSSSDVYGNYYKVVPREGEYCVLRYKIIPQYKSEFLREHLLPPQTTLLISAFFLILLSLICIALRFGKVLRKKINPLIFATQKIQNQELAFSIEPDNIKELNTVLYAMNQMRLALKESLEKQWRLEQLRKEQIAALAHDVKTPLTLIRGNAELLEDADPTDEQADYIHYIKEGSAQIQNYLQILMEVSKSNEGMQARRSNVVTEDFLRSIKKQAKGLCMVKNIQFNWECSYQTQTIYIDYSLLERAMNNIILNAVDHTPSAGTIGLKVREDKEYLLISISDNGEGFSAEALKHAKEQFYMGNGSRNSKSHYGMGLYIAESVMKQHGGQLILENVSGAHGANVICKFRFIK